MRSFLRISAAVIGVVATLYAQQGTVLRYKPVHSELKYTFGGTTPVRQHEA